jgi:hypothetical protein
MSTRYVGRRLVLIVAVLADLGAAALEHGRPCSVHTIQPRALELVAKRFLELAWRTEASA